jgi:hypothetical protein
VEPLLKGTWILLSIFIYSVDWRIPQGAWIPSPIVLTESLFSILAAWWVFSNVVWTSTHWYVAFPKASVRPFGGLTMRFFKGHETLGWNILVFQCANFRHFGSLKKRFLPCRYILQSRPTGFMSTTALHFGYLKMWFIKVLWDPSIKGIWLSLRYN